MLLRRAVLDRIAGGEIDLAFRRWTRPTVKTGGSLRTSLGLLAIERVEEVAIDEITEEDARRAGLELDELLGFLRRESEGEVYRVELGGLGPDPRVALRQDDALSDEDVAEIGRRLDRLDARSSRDPWTRQVLDLIGRRPHVRAHDLADGLGLEKDVFKNDVRKLKSLGLTISHSPGYELSPRGRAFLDRDRDRGGSSAAG